MTLKQFRTHYPKEYGWLRYNNPIFLEKFHKICKKNGYWNLKTCKASALKFSNKTEWQKKERPAYNAAWKNGWIDTCCSHMPSHRQKKSVINLGTGSKYATVSEAAKHLSYDRKNLTIALKTGRKAYGYRWAYCDEEGNVL